jgi:hypothetical protein
VGGYWGRPQHLGSWTGYDPTDLFATAFGVPATGNPKLLQAANMNGGGESALMRHAAAALLDSASSGVDFKSSTAQVIAMVTDACASGNFESTRRSM